jgi:actin-related protein 5
MAACTSFGLKAATQALIAKIKDRARRKAALTDRKSAAAQARMKNIASLAADDRVPKAKKRKGDRGTFAEAKFTLSLF